MDDQNPTPQTFDLNSNTPAPTGAIPENPLNTGNGMPTPTPMPTAATNAPEEVPHPIDLSAQLDTQSIIPPTMNSIDTKSSSTKKYIIIAIVAILVITVGFAAYSFFSGDSTETAPPAETTSLTNSLSSETDPTEVSKEMQEVVEVVEELKDVFPKESPPSLILDLSQTDEETVEVEETPKKISR